MLRTPGQHLSAPQIGPSNPLSDPSPVLPPLTTHEYNYPSSVLHNSRDIGGENEDMDDEDNEENEYAKDDEDDEDDVGSDCYANGPEHGLESMDRRTSVSSTVVTINRSSAGQL